MPKSLPILALLSLSLFLHVPAQAQSFEVATVKPTSPDTTDQSWDREDNRLSIQNHTLRLLIKRAYGLNANAQILNGPEWIDKQRFDISAKIDEDDMTKMKTMPPLNTQKEVERMLQSLLAERFHLKVKQETRPLPTYALVIDGAKGKDKLTPVTTSGSSISSNNGQIKADSISMDNLAKALARTRDVGDRPVLNRTGLTGAYTFEFNWTPDRGIPQPDSTYPGLFTALREQLGLKLEEQTNPVPVVVIEAATLPVLD